MEAIESKAYNSALKIYQQFMHKYPDFFMTHRIKRKLSNSKGDGMKFYYYDDDDHVVVNSGQPVIAFSEELPDDEFIMSDHKSIIAWKYAKRRPDGYNSHDGDVDYDLFRLPSYNDYELNTIYWCKKFGFMRKLSELYAERRVQSTYYEILEVYTDDGRPSDFVYVNSTRRHILKIYLKEFERKYKKTLIKV